MKYLDLTTDQKTYLLLGLSALPYSTTMINNVLKNKNPDVNFNSSLKVLEIPYHTDWNTISDELRKLTCY